MKKNKRSPTRVERPEPQRLDDVLRMLVQHKTSAIICRYLAEHTAEVFRGTDARGPKKLLVMPNGTKCRAEVEDVLRVEAMLQQMAVDATMKAGKLEAAGVLVAGDALVSRNVSGGPVPPAPEGEGVVDSALAGTPR